MIVFVSYDMAADAERRDGLVSHLRESGYAIATLPHAGQPLPQALSEKIRQADACVWIATRESVASPWCQSEVAAFWGSGKTVIVLAEPGITGEDLPPILREVVRAADHDGVEEALRASFRRYAYRGIATANSWSWDPRSPGIDLGASNGTRYSEQRVIVTARVNADSDGMYAARVEVDVEVTPAGERPTRVRVIGRGSLAGTVRDGQLTAHYVAHDVDQRSPLWGGTMYVRLIHGRGYAHWIARGAGTALLVLGKATWEPTGRAASTAAPNRPG